MNAAIKKKKRLRSGCTTGACAAAAAKAAATLLFANETPEQVTITFPDGSPHNFAVNSSIKIGADAAQASIIKDAGDDPDVTNGAEIMVQLACSDGPTKKPANHLTKDKITVIFLAGDGVGTVSKAGLAIPPGEPAINPVPRMMILTALIEAVKAARKKGQEITFSVTVTIPNGKALAKKTLNHRLGIIGGLSILGTTGVVRPISASAWTATIKASMDVAKVNGCSEMVISTGRTSEKAAQTLLALPEEAYAMMGDYLHFSLTEAKNHQFKKIHLSAMWAKIVKAAMEIPQTHVRHGALEAEEAAKFISRLADDPGLYQRLTGSNTAREIYQRLAEMDRHDVHKIVCRKAQEYAEKVSGIPVNIYLIHTDGKVVIK